MSARQVLKKKIYKAKEKGLDTSELELKLENMGYTLSQQLQMKQSEITEIYRKLDRCNYESSIVDKYMGKINQLDPEIRKLKEEINKDKPKKWELPYSIKHLINKRGFYGYETVQKVEKSLSKIQPKNIEIISNSENTRYIVLSVDGKKMRFNLMSKKQFVSQNHYWLSKKNCKYDYTNCVKHIY